MEREFYQTLQELLPLFERQYVEETIKAQGGKSPLPLFTFEDFLAQPTYHSQAQLLREYADAQHKPLERLIFNAMSEPQRNRIGGLFGVPSTEQLFILSGLQREQHDELEKMLADPAFREIRKTFPFLSPDQMDALAAKLASSYLQKMGPDVKKALTEGSIKQYILNMGFMMGQRVSHREAIDIIVKYAALFPSEQEVLESMMERYADEVLSRAPIEKTQEVIDELHSFSSKVLGGHHGS